MPGAKLGSQNVLQGLERDLTICYMVLETTLTNNKGKIIHKIAATNFVATSLHDIEPLQRHCLCHNISSLFIEKSTFYVIPAYYTSDEGTHSPPEILHSLMKRGESEIKNITKSGKSPQFS